jgi:hypothetical protein
MLSWVAESIVATVRPWRELLAPVVHDAAPSPSSENQCTWAQPASSRIGLRPSDALVEHQVLEDQGWASPPIATGTSAESVSSATN